MSKIKKESHTGLRNNALFCFNCGQSFKYELPAPVKQFSDQCKAFEKLHQHCKKTWVEPVPEPEGKDMHENIAWWIANGEQGISSCTMLYFLAGYAIGGQQPTLGHPSDIDDFKRCYKFLQAVPQLKRRLPEMKRQVWSNLVDNWDKLTGMYEDLVEKQQDNSMYDFMKSLGC